MGICFVEILLKIIMLWRQAQVHLFKYCYH
uniref:Uncharacterized protein n=1 Tax=Anguilla anguilla TaxID=7936 RepID=A0A0E9UB10_ANGAN